VAAELWWNHEAKKQKRKQKNEENIMKENIISEATKKEERK